MPLSRSIIQWVRVSIGLVSSQSRPLNRKMMLLRLGWSEQSIKQSPTPSALPFDITWPDKYIPFMERTALLHCWGTLGVENTTSKNIKPTILVDGLQNTWPKQQRNTFICIYFGQSRLTLTPTQPNGAWAAPSPGPKSCWSKSLRRLGFLVPFLALMVLLRAASPFF